MINNSLYSSTIATNVVRGQEFRNYKEKEGKYKWKMKKKIEKLSPSQTEMVNWKQEHDIHIAR